MAKTALAEKKNGLVTHGSIKSALNQWKDETVITYIVRVVVRVIVCYCVFLR